MPHAPHDSTRSNPLFLSSIVNGTGIATQAFHRSRVCGWVLIAVLLASTSWTGAVAAQDWGESEDGWSSNPPPSRGVGGSSPWSLRTGIGFTSDPNDFLLNFELPYSFDQYISVGPMMQIGIEDDRSIVAPTANLTLTIPNMPGQNFDRFHPFIFSGIGFAVIENDDRAGDDQSAGFLINAGFGLDYVLSEHLSIGSRMILNFLPERTLDEKFFFSWEVGGIRLSF
ncbi:MAG: hypothetical protein CL933_16330 [Deltaproteobacteria bacterium]|nr:hypothetical protein [Deltaproteobacteria bacterium]